MKKIIFLFVMIFTLIGCQMVEISSSYGHRPISSKEIEIDKKVEIDAEIMDSSKKEISPLERIIIRSKIKNNSIKEAPKTIKIISNNKEYLINVDPKYNTIYSVSDKGIVIDSDSFTLEIGNIKFEDGTTLYIPPLLFKRHIYVYKINNFLDTLNQDTREDLFKGTIDEYREWKKKNMK